MRRNLLHAENSYILEPLLKVVIARIEAFVVSENQFLYAFVKEVCRL
jgi:hypothetical protein